MTHTSIPAGARIGHVHLKVADIDRSIRFYHDLLGFDLVTRFGPQAAFLSAGGYHHHHAHHQNHHDHGKHPERTEHDLLAAVCS